ncbi:Glutamyl-tRNA(Gln) amidotransferase subunit B, mitochondrial [Candida viswanathii]|uniref:Glutamyl-tRNA(Gln) amidotransferase subunit B, mitochondrial n=1 Tax=Candida viswanathii TaxID=5486 RepID=A0A367Y5H9_9ASCO|nr:Glutamyl-tRNA(Gln) amidotransferase subunit B, mitochondrial [Candida viswanathii]
MFIRRLHNFSYNPKYKLKCGLEIHTQLKTKYKLFSLSRTSYNAKPNTKISYFDVGLPGTQPKLNPEALLLALKAAVAFNAEIQPYSTFDRKHYFYPDQPLGYQITQHYYPLAKNGYLDLGKYDNVPDKRIHLEQVQLEQDTGKTVNFEDKIQVDYNRANTPLIEVVTKPDFETIEQVQAFVRKYQLLVRHLNICTGDLETGAMRVDANISVNGNPRVEIKNLGSSGEIVDALQFEYKRQLELLEQGKEVAQETRGWNGEETEFLRNKEVAVDYRYMPDSELPAIRLDEKITQQLKESLEELPDSVLERLTNAPYKLELAHAKNLLAQPEVLEYYETVFDKIPNANKWFFQELLAAFAKRDVEFDVGVVPPSMLVDIAKKVETDEISLTAARIILKHIVENRPSATLAELIELLDLQKPEDTSDLKEAIQEICRQIIANNPDVVARIASGHKNALQVLVGQAMKATKGKVHAKDFKAQFEELLKQ